MASCSDGVTDLNESEAWTAAAPCETRSPGRARRASAARSPRTAFGRLTQGTCTASSVRYGVRNGSETGIDCGGPCTALAQPQLCPAGSGCLTATDCASGSCDSGYTSVFARTATIASWARRAVRATSARAGTAPHAADRPTAGRGRAPSGGIASERGPCTSRDGCCGSTQERLTSSRTFPPRGPKEDMTARHQMEGLVWARAGLLTAVGALAGTGCGTSDSSSHTPGPADASADAASYPIPTITGPVSGGSTGSRSTRPPSTSRRTATSRRSTSSKATRRPTRTRARRAATASGPSKTTKTARYQIAHAGSSPERPGEVQRNGSRRVAQRVRRRRRRRAEFSFGHVELLQKRLRLRRHLGPGAGRHRRRILPRSRGQRAAREVGPRAPTDRCSTRATITPTTSSRRRPMP